MAASDAPLVRGAVRFSAVQVLGFADRREGEVQTEQEWRVEIKTAADWVAALAEHIKANHSYDVPRSSRP